MTKYFVSFVLCLNLTASCVYGAEKCVPALHISYINGVLNDREEASESMDRLVELVTRASLVSKTLAWQPEWASVTYNQTRGLVDIFEAYEQKQNESASDFWLWLGDTLRAPKWFQKKIGEILRRQYTSDETEASLFRSEVDLEEKILKKRLKVLMVAHSQGNFFGNELVRRMRNSLVLHWENDKKSVRLVSVATPASQVVDGGPHTTLTSDWVIRPIPLALAANVTNSDPAPGLLDHEFIRHYLRGDQASAKIKRDIAVEVEKLASLGADVQVEDCMQWLQHYRQKRQSNDCVTACAAYPTDMDTFICPNMCEQLCGCIAAP